MGLAADVGAAVGVDVGAGGAGDVAVSGISGVCVGVDVGDGVTGTRGFVNQDHYHLWLRPVRVLRAEPKAAVVVYVR